jgi:hypothetical protein
MFFLVYIVLYKIRYNVTHIFSLFGANSFEAEALDTPIDLDWQETADTLGLSIPQLQERMASRLGDVVFAWELIPNEHQPAIEAVKRDNKGTATRTSPWLQIQPL